MKNTIKFTAAIALLSGLNINNAMANDIVPAKPETQAMVFTNATIHTATDGVITNGQLRVDNGKIVNVAEQVDTTNAKVVDLAGKHIYPGLVALDTSLGLVEISLVRETVDKFEIGDVNPQLNPKTAYNADSEIIPTVRYNGIAYAQVVPSGTGIAGQSIVVNMDAWNVNDAIVESGHQMHLYWPSIRWRSSNPKTLKKQQQQVQNRTKKVWQAFEDGYRFYLARKTDKKVTGDQKLASMMPLYRGEGQLFVHAQKQEQIEQAISLARKYNFELVIVGGYDAWRVAPSLNEIKAKVIYNRTLGLPLRRDEPVEQAYKVPALLKQAGVPFALGFSADWDARNLSFAAGQAVAYGLTKEEALKAITSDAAKILKLDNIGAIAKGYQASFLISSGDILDPVTAKIESLYIDGRKVDLNNRHNQLYQKYLKR
ncbi:amidohydrolase family protein [Shewanella sp. 202IG2-18]|uniref:amidohydrolase family protein n=1 Tax=Parashewanella hymeniacidonis TaxID=2807618 RepID=UPI00196102D2|nr:amidohydrolase family protein [Parashewanella hymeniacidonis]MBM7071753.1 amidohydrolase family protein [Parashewanella hymeniacidonis]